MIQFISRFIGVLILSFLSTRFFHLNDRHLIMIGCASQLASLIFIGSARTTWSVAMATVCCFGLSGISVGVRSTLTKHVPPEKTGTISFFLSDNFQFFEPRCSDKIECTLTSLYVFETVEKSMFHETLKPVMMGRTTFFSVHQEIVTNIDKIFKDPPHGLVYSEYRRPCPPTSNF